MQPRSFASFPELEEEKPKKPEKVKQKTHSSSRHSSAKPRIDDSTDRICYSDRRGDTLNVQYASASQVPKYHLVGHGKRILGLPGYTVVHRTSNAVEVDLNTLRRIKNSDLTDSRTRKLLDIPPQHRILEPSNSRQYQEIEGVISLPSGPRPSASTAPFDIFSESSDDESVDSEHSGRDAKARTLPFNQEALRSLEEQLTVSPNSIDRWMRLVSLSLTSIPLSSRNASQARAEVALSILSRCMKAHPDNASSPLVQLQYLVYGEQTWPESRVKDEWETALKLGHPDIWVEWINWKIRKTRNDLEDMAEASRRALNCLRDEVAMIRVLWRTAEAFRASGFTERATALFQAQGELAFHTPPLFSALKFTDLLDKLEEYWEAETPRLGEPNAMGWDTPQPEATTPSVTPTPTKPSTLGTWEREESKQDRLSIFPCRSSDNSSDPFSTVFFTEIRDFLFPITTPAAKDVFRKAWMSFVGLHIPGFVESLSIFSWDDKWCSTFLNKPSYLHALLPPRENAASSRDYVNGISVGKVRNTTSSFGPLQSWGYGLRRPLDCVISGRGEAVSIWSAVDLDALPPDYPRRLFYSLCIEGGDEEWTTLHIAFEAAVNVKRALKVSRKFLSDNQTSFLLWANHALLQRSSGQIQDARKLYQTVLLDAPSSADSLRASLWWDWAELEWLTGDDTQSLRIAFLAAEVSGEGATAVLRAKRSLEDRADNASSRQVRESYIKLRALLELVTSHDSSAALNTFDRHLERLDGIAHESLLLASLAMLYRYTVVLRHPHPPSTLQERARQAFMLYPNNTFFHGILLASEKSSDPLLTLQSTTRTHQVARSLIGQLGEMWHAGWKAGHWYFQVEKIRSGLLGCLDDYRLYGSPILWRIAIELEIKCGDHKKAKQLVYRAISDCPLDKGLYMLAFGALRLSFAPHELSRLEEQMTQLLRLRTGLDEIQIEPQNFQSEMVGSDEDMTDDVVHAAAEKKRLMPY